jgi:SAM-dependent methyltransferase
VVRIATRGSAPERNRALFDGALGRLYDFYIEREALSRLVAGGLWGGSVRPFYASMDMIAEVREGGLIVDAPCGGGVAFRALRPGQSVRYLALDLSPGMVHRARGRAQRLGLEQIEFVHGEAEAIPVDDDSTDLFLSYWGLHCFPDPARAVAEAARCLRRGGVLVGSMITTGDTVRHRLLVRPGSAGFGPGGNPHDLKGWLRDAGLEQVNIRTSGLFAYFGAKKSS